MILQKKLIVLLNISDLDPDLSISWGIFFENKGDNGDFWNHGIRKVKKNKGSCIIVIEKEVDDFVDENDAMEVSESVRRETAASVVEVEEIKVVTN
jgi:DNA polymerase-3 subunit alpha